MFLVVVQLYPMINSCGWRKSAYSFSFSRVFLQKIMFSLRKAECKVPSLCERMLLLLIAFPESLTGEDFIPIAWKKPVAMKSSTRDICNIMQQRVEWVHRLPSLKLTAKAPENGWLEDEISFWDGLFSGANCSRTGAEKNRTAPQLRCSRFSPRLVVWWLPVFGHLGPNIELWKELKQ